MARRTPRTENAYQPVRSHGVVLDRLRTGGEVQELILTSPGPPALWVRFSVKSIFRFSFVLGCIAIAHSTFHKDKEDDKIMRKRDDFFPLS